MNKGGSDHPVLTTLRELSISPCLESRFHGPRRKYYIDFQALNTPNLERLHLSMIHILYCPALPRVRRIHLNKMSMSLPDMFTMLRSSPELGELELEHVRGAFGLPLDAMPMINHSIVCLKRLVLFGGSETVARAILGFFCFPNMRDFVVLDVTETQYRLSAGTPWHHQNDPLPDLDRSTLPNALYKTVGAFSERNHCASFSLADLVG